jgi:hypothetical protein
MSRNNPIPEKLREKFLAYVSGHDDYQAPDGAWFARLESAADVFMHKHGLNKPWHCRNSAAHQYLRLKDLTEAGKEKA